MAGKRSSTGGAAKYIIIMILAAMVVLGAFLMISRPWKQTPDEENMVLTEVQKITTRNLEINYPENEREVIRFFSETMQVLYAQQCTDKEMEAIADQLMIVYDDEFLLNQPNYTAQLKKEVAQKHTDGYTIQRYVVPEKGDFSNTWTDEYDRTCIGTDKVLYSIRNGAQFETVYYTFILRKDDEDRWKIFGWAPSEDQTLHLIQ